MKPATTALPRAGRRSNGVPKQVVVIGAGPAGLTAAYEATRFGIGAVVLEKSGEVGGLARTAVYKGFHFDMGGHRFFTKAPRSKKMWREVLGGEFLRRPRLSRIYYGAGSSSTRSSRSNALAGLGIWQALAIARATSAGRSSPTRRRTRSSSGSRTGSAGGSSGPSSKRYTEKVWGVPCSELKAEWAAQRIKDLSLKTAVLSMFLRRGTDHQDSDRGVRLPASRPRHDVAGGARRDRSSRRTVELERDVIASSTTVGATPG